MASSIGRTAELALLRDLGRTSRVRSVVGPAGVGKSHLAMRLVAASGGARRAGVVAVDVAAVADGAVLPEVIARACGVEPTATARWWAGLISRLSTRRGLLLLDNCERWIDECAELAAVLVRACPQLEVLASSREPLGIGGEVVVRLAPLAVPPPGASWPDIQTSDAVRLFVAHVRARVPTFAANGATLSAVAHICRRLEGLALALQIVAAHVPGLGLERLVARIDPAYALDLAGAPDAPPRQRTLRASLDWSHRLLGDAERVLFRRLASCVGGWTLEAAEAVGADGRLRAAQVAASLERLAATSLVVVEHEATSARYRYPAIVRQYALECLRRAGELEAVQERHATYMLRVTAGVQPWRFSSDDAACVGRERGNLRAALRAAVRSDADEVAFRLAMAAYPFWYLHGCYAEGWAWLRRYLDAPSGRDYADRRALVGCLAGHLALLAGHPRAAQAQLEDALAAQRARGDHERIALAIYLLALVALWRGDAGRAQALCGDTHAVLQRVEIEGGLTRLLQSALPTLSARVAWELDEDGQAQALADHAAALARARQDRFWLARAAHVQALAAERSTGQAHARRLLERALVLQRAHGDAEGLVDTLCAAGHLAFGAGALREGLDAYAEAIRLAGTSGEPLGVVWGLEGIARGLASSRPADAVRLMGACEGLRARLDCAAWPSHRHLAATWLPLAAAQLGPARYAAALADGHHWSQADAVRLVQNLTGRHQPRGHPAGHVLSRREREVADLVAQGHTNRQIAGALGVRLGTVRSHIDHILTKLGAHSRTQMAVWVLSGQRERER